VALQLARAEAQLNAEVDATMAARAAGQSLWGTELRPLVLQKVLEYLQWEPAVCGVMRAVCSTWSSMHHRLAASSTGPTGLGGGYEGQAGVVPERGGGEPDGV
jgi:hypothetical protein